MDPTKYNQVLNQRLRVIIGNIGGTHPFFSVCVRQNNPVKINRKACLNKFKDYHKIKHKIKWRIYSTTISPLKNPSQDTHLLINLEFITFQLDWNSFVLSFYPPEDALISPVCILADGIRNRGVSFEDLVADTVSVQNKMKFQSSLSFYN